MDPWYRKAFREEYRLLYAHRDEREAATAVGLLGRLTRLEGERVLDVACGTGRHLGALGERGAVGVGVDLSADLLQHAREKGRVVRGDMRSLPFADSSFQGALNMFTSFGYFSTDEENAGVLSEISRVVSHRDGWLLLDYLNPRHVLRNLVPEGRREVGPFTVLEKRRFDRDRRLLIKEVVFDGGAKEGVDRWEERVRLFEREELESLLLSAGLGVVGSFGGYDGSPLTAESPRMVLFCSRDPSREGRKR